MRLARITASPVWALRSAPHYDSCSYGRRGGQIEQTQPAQLRPLPFPYTLPDQARWVDTGEPIPDGFDAVIMVEVVEELDDTTIQDYLSCPALQPREGDWEEDIVASELLAT